MSAEAKSAGGLRIDQLRAGYGETVVLDGVSLDLPPGGTLAMLGRNGVGKTTLLATIMGHTTLHGGTIEFGGENIAGFAPYRRARLGIGFVPQEREIFRSLTVEENLLVAARSPAGPPGAGRSSGSTISSHRSPTGAATAAMRSRAASSRCSASAAR